MWEPSENFPAELKSFFSFLEKCPTPCLAVDTMDRIRGANAAFLEAFEDFLPADAETLEQLNWVPLDEEGKPARGAKMGMELLLRNLQKGISSILCSLHTRQPSPRFRLSIAPCQEMPDLHFLWLEFLCAPETSEPSGRARESSLSLLESQLTGLYSQLLRMESVMDAQQAVCRHLLNFLQCSTVFMLQADPDPKPAAVAGEWGADYWKPIPGSAVMDAHPALLAFLGQKLVHIRDTQSVPELGRLREWCRQHQVGSILALPVSTTESHFGVLCLFHRQLFAFSPSTVTTLEQLATDLALLLSKIESFQKVEHCRKKFLHIQQSLQVLAQASREFTAILEFKSEQVAWLHLSPSCAQLLEIPEERLWNLPSNVFSMLADRRLPETILESLRKGAPFEDMWEFRTGKGRKRFFQAHLQPREAAPDTWDLLCIDVTDIVSMRDSCRRSLALWKVVANLGERLKGPDFRTHLPDVLADFGKSAEASRAYIFENHVSETGELLTSQWMEWVADGIAPQIQNPDLQALSLVENGFQRWIDELGANRPIFGNVIDFPVAEQEPLLLQNIQSIVVMPIFVDGQWWGFLGLDECRSARQWSEPEIESLRTAAALIGNAISRERSRSESMWLEQQLQSAARRENLGKLAHGIAHQFNNLLSPILGYISVALYDLPPGSPLAQDLKQVLSAAERAKELAHQLLRFGTRVEYRMQLLPATRLADVFRRFFEETRIPVQSEFSGLSENLMLRADPEQLQAAVFSFLRRALPADSLDSRIIHVNASVRKNMDASRETGNLFLLLEIPTTLQALPNRFPDASLSGINWSEIDLIQALDILDHFNAKATLPIRTTNPVVLIDFPLVNLEEKQTPSGPLPAEKSTRHAAILVVEDEDAVRNFVVRALAKEGHAVLNAPDPRKALDLVRTRVDALDLLITDVIMPHMSGKRLYQELKKFYPQLRVIYMSGYTANLLEKQGVAPEKRNFLAKPFGISALLKRVEETLAEE